MRRRLVAGEGFEPPTFGLWAQRELLYNWIYTITWRISRHIYIWASYIQDQILNTYGTPLGTVKTEYANQLVVWTIDQPEWSRSCGIQSILPIKLLKGSLVVGWLWITYHSWKTGKVKVGTLGSDLVLINLIPYIIMWMLAIVMWI